MKYTKKFATVVLMLMLVLALAIPTFAKSKAKKPKLSKKSVTLYVKDKTTITLKNAKASKVKWSTSKKSVATVKKGKITAKKKGTAYIKAKYKGKTYKCKVTVKLRKAPVSATSPNAVTRELNDYVDGNGNFKPGVITPAPITQTSMYSGTPMKLDPKRDTSTTYIIWKGTVTKDIPAFIYTDYPLVKINGKWHLQATNSTSYGTPICVKMIDANEGEVSHTGVLNYVRSTPEVEVVKVVNSMMMVYAMDRYNGGYHVNPGQTFTVTVEWRGVVVDIPFYVPAP